MAHVGLLLLLLFRMPLIVMMWWRCMVMHLVRVLLLLLSMTQMTAHVCMWHLTLLLLLLLRGLGSRRIQTGYVKVIFPTAPVRGGVKGLLVHVEGVTMPVRKSTYWAPVELLLLLLLLGMQHLCLWTTVLWHRKAHVDIILQTLKKRRQRVDKSSFISYIVQ